MIVTGNKVQVGIILRQMTTLMLDGSIHHNDPDCLSGHLYFKHTQPEAMSLSALKAPLQATVSAGKLQMGGFFYYSPARSQGWLTPQAEGNGPFVYYWTAFNEASN